MTAFVTDTHPLNWALFSTQRLSPRVQTLFSDILVYDQHELFIPVSVIAELVMVIEKQRTPATISMLQVVLELFKRKPNIHILPLTEEIAFATHTLTNIPDIFDRFVVAEARRLNVPLITRDTVITASGLISTVWD